MHEAILYEKLANSRVQCNICQWHCRIGQGKSGVCQMYQNRDGTLYNLNYAEASSVAVDPIEKKPLFHFFPASLVFSLGSWGCNFHCQDCQNCHRSSYCEQSSSCVGSSYLVLCHSCSDCTYCFGCIGLAKKDFHILNVKYGKNQYFRIVKALKAEMGL